METTDSTFTHIGVKKVDKRKIAILAKVQGGNIYEMVGAWADEAWNKAKAEGVVSDAMIPLAERAHWVGQSGMMMPVKVESKKKAGVKA
ncbi:MAG: hypothetical protein HY865_09415 [Chloroflexi bacterium]|nr:hypothetical protein [Chloroflexota bacterium]